jgi:hypothetical protein
MSDRRPEESRSDGPATLYATIQQMIGEGLRARYEVPQVMPHTLLVLLMQMNENQRQKQKSVRSGHSSSDAVHRRSSK